jgi:hypothetical protein
MRKLLAKIKRFFNPPYSIVYTTKDGRTQMYTIDKPKHEAEFGNIAEGRRAVGFRSYCHNRGAIRSFRYDRITSINKA